ncbi:MAG: sulfite exporter TauE/SafE family protein [Actinobacteria bacterium]|nr:sulfite exporter TauE/SafE family protein [Actinomycetota bacterium]
MLGLGGGIIVIPFLTILLGVDIRHAIGASIVSVIATSSGAAAAYVRDRVTNIRIGMFLESATTTGAITGAFLAGLFSVKALYIVFSGLLLYSAVAMFQKRNQELPQGVVPHPWSDRLKLNGSYYDQAVGEKVGYVAAGIPQGFGMMFVAGVLSGLLGIGSGLFKVLGMDVFMKLPLKVSTATSNFMIGVTAAASAGVYFARGQIDPLVAGPVALGVLLGAALGSKIMVRVKNATLRKIFVPVLVYVSLQMLVKGLGV